MNNNSKIVIIVCCVCVLLLQFWLAPSINIFGGKANFGIAAIVALSLVLNDRPRILMCVLMGLALDLTQSEPLGAYTLLFVLTNVVICSLLADSLGSSDVANSIIAFFGALLVSLADALIVGIATPGASFVDLIATGSLIGAILNGLIAVILCFLFSRLIKTNQNNMWGTRF